jgi:hypothetical protein
MTAVFESAVIAFCASLVVVCAAYVAYMMLTTAAVLVRYDVARFAAWSRKRIAGDS